MAQPKELNKGRVLDREIESIGQLALWKCQGSVRGCVLNKNHMAVGRADSLIQSGGECVGYISRFSLTGGSGVATSRASSTYGVASVGINLPLWHLLVGG